MLPPQVMLTAVYMRAVLWENLHWRSAADASWPLDDAPAPYWCGGQWLLIGVRDVFSDARCCGQCLIDRQLCTLSNQSPISAPAGRVMRLTSQVPKSSPGRRGPASFDEECSSTTDGATTSVAGCQSVRTQQDAWCEVDYLGAADGARNSCARAGGDR